MIPCLPSRGVPGRQQAWREAWSVTGHQCGRETAGRCTCVYLPEAHGHQEDAGRSYCGWKGHGDCEKKPAGKPVSSGMRVPTWRRDQEMVTRYTAADGSYEGWWCPKTSLEGCILVGDSRWPWPRMMEQVEAAWTEIGQESKVGPWCHDVVQVSTEPRCRPGRRGRGPWICLWVSSEINKKSLKLAEFTWKWLD